MGLQFLIISMAWLAVELQAIPVIHHPALSKISDLPNNHSMLPAIPKTASSTVNSEGPSIWSVIPELAQAFPAEFPSNDSAIGETPLEQIQGTEHRGKDYVIPKSIIPERISSMPPIHKSLPPSDRSEGPFVRPIIPEAPLAQVQPIKYSGKGSVIPTSLPAWISEFLPPSDRPGRPSIPEWALANVQPADLWSVIFEDSLKQDLPQEQAGKRTLIPANRRPPPPNVLSSEISRKPSFRLANSKNPSTSVRPLQVPGKSSILPTVSESSVRQFLLLKLPNYFQYYQQLHTINQYNFYL